MKSYTWKIGGEAGYGILTSGTTFSKIAARLGNHLFDYIEYPSLIRGGHNAYEVIFSDEETTGFKETVDCLVCLDKATFDNNKHRLHAKSFIVYDPGEFEPEGEFTSVAIPFKQMLQELQGQVVMKNTIALAASLALLGAPLDIFERMIEEQFAKKGENVVSFNKLFAQKGDRYVKEKFPQYIQSIFTARGGSQELVLSGNDAFALGAAIADCRLYSAYPMTPSSTVLTTLAAWQEKTGMVVRHAEDEIAVINTAIGSSFAGVRSAVGTSGGGFALMVEALSFAGIIETPVVVFIAQRPGPATGMPTWTEQGDLLFVVHAGHGEFPKIVLAPGDAREMIELTASAFNLADIYQTPVIVLSDMFLSESHTSFDKTILDQFIASYQISRGKTVTIPSKTPYLRYAVTEDGISERLIPGAKGTFYQANSYEHVEDGHTTEEALPRKAQVEKRNKKGETYLKNDFVLPAVYGDLGKAETVFVSWGSTKGPLLEAQRLLSQTGAKTAILHFTHLYPLDPQKLASLFETKKRYILVENNSQGQLGKLLRMETGITISEKLLKYDGRPFLPTEIARYIIPNLKFEI